MCSPEIVKSLQVKSACPQCFNNCIHTILNCYMVYAASYFICHVYHFLDIQLLVHSVCYWRSTKGSNVDSGTDPGAFTCIKSAAKVPLAALIQQRWISPWSYTEQGHIALQISWLWNVSGPMVRHCCHGLTIFTHPSLVLRLFKSI